MLLKSFWLTLLLMLSPALVAQTQGHYPSKPVRLIVPFPAGQATDIVARLMAESLAKIWGQQVYVENRSGVPGMVAGRDAAPDGYTITLGTSGTLAVNPAVFSKLPYDTNRDFVLLNGAAIAPMVLVANPGLPFNNLKDLIDAARREPGKFNLGYGGVNNTQHLGGELFKYRVGIDLVGVNYKGSAAAVTDLLGGQIPLLVDSLAATLPHIKSGKIKPLASFTLQRLPQLPDLPTVAELGYPGFEGVGWAGLVLPKGTPNDLVEKIGADIRRVLDEPLMRERILERGMVADPRGPKEWGDFVSAEVVKWSEAAKRANLKAAD
ncbi:MAG: tripartite tricarboxylate transporter substrate binding protein [Burkholderiaceae bacterium]